MRPGTKLVVIGSVIAAGVLLERRRQRAGKRPVLAGGSLAHATAGGGPVAERGAGDVTIPPGISQVDPQPLTQISAEAIDPDATRAAHDDVVAQRERLAVPGKNVP